MTKPKILVTGATGKTGGAVASTLLAAGWPVRVLVRSRDSRAAALERRGAELAVADLQDPIAMRVALRGVQRAYWVAPFDPKAWEAAAIFADAAVGERLEALVSLSQWLASEHHPALATRHAFATDRLFLSLPGITTTIVNPGFFADNYLRLIGFAAQLGVLPSLTGDSENAPPSNEDIARVCAAALIAPGDHAGRRYRPTGPELLSTKDMARILSGVLQRPVLRMEMPLWLFLKAARMQRVSAYELSNYRQYIRDHKQGAFAANAPNDVVEIVTGRAAESFETIARRYALRPEAQRSVGSMARAWLDFMLTPMMPGYNLKQIEKALGARPPTPTRFAMQDEAWRASHLISSAA